MSEGFFSSIVRFSLFASAFHPPFIFSSLRWTSGALPFRVERFLQRGVDVGLGEERER